MVILPASLAAGCVQGLPTSYAERIDVWLTVTMTVNATAKDDWGKRCFVSYHMVITNEGTETAFARDCVARGLDDEGAEVVQATPVGFGPAGAGVDPGQPYVGDGTIFVDITKRQRGWEINLSLA